MGPGVDVWREGRLYKVGILQLVGGREGIVVGTGAVVDDDTAVACLLPALFRPYYKLWFHGSRQVPQSPSAMTLRVCCLPNIISGRECHRKFTMSRWLPRSAVAGG